MKDSSEEVGSKEVSSKEVSSKVGKRIWGECAATCCMCKRYLIRPCDNTKFSILGQIAHIVAKEEIGPRGNSDLSISERNSADNLLLLCSDCHKIIDDHPEEHTVQSLHQIKAEHINWIKTRLAKPQPWRSNISQYTYINVPRLSEQAELKGYGVDLSRYKSGQTLHSLGFELNYVMRAFEIVLAQIAIDAVPIDKVILHEGVIGSAISFDSKAFYTKNIRMSESKNFTGNINKVPHIYTKLKQFRVVIFIDAQWITTTTAFALFRSGQISFTGLGIITNVNYEDAVLTVTPWVIGIPQPKYPLILNREEEVERPPEINSNLSLSLDDLVDMERAKRDNILFNPPPEYCDICRKSLKKEKYMIDGKDKISKRWACMCEICFKKQGSGIRYGSGQLYIQDEKGWLRVAGGRDKDDDDESLA
jgi:hypothetical protein